MPLTRPETWYGVIVGLFWLSVMRISSDSLTPGSHSAFSLWVTPFSHISFQKVRHAYLSDSDASLFVFSGEDRFL